MASEIGPNTAQVQRMRARGVHMEIVRAYTELNQIRDDFLIGHNGFKIPFLIVVGNPGLSKSYQFERITDGYYTNSASSAFGLYKLAFHNLNKPLVLDDIDTILKDAATISLLKALGNDREVKTVSWEKRIPPTEGVPNQYKTQSRLCLLFNELPCNNMNVSAVLDRARFVLFHPTVNEVHNYVQQWFPTEFSEIVQFIGENVHRVERPSIRLYTKARDQMKLGKDWKAWLEEQWVGDNPLIRIAGEIVHSSLPIGKPQLQEWMRRTGKSRARWFEYQRLYRDLHGLNGETARLNSK
jgi:hypothetical protein